MASNQPFGFESDPWGQLVLVLSDGTRHAGVSPVRAFPITDPGGPLSVLDAEGREVVAVPRMDGLPAAVRERLEAVLAERHFLPTVTRVVRVTGRTEPVQCEAETDRGVVRFTINGEEDVRRLPGGRVLIVDSQGMRYLIPDVKELSPASLRQLARYL